MPNLDFLGRHPHFRRVHDYLQAKAPPGQLPGRQHIEPMELRDVLPYVMLVDVLPQPQARPRYRIRLVGTQVAAVQGEDATGKYVEQVLDKGTDVIAAYGEILVTRQPQHRSGMVATTGREHVNYERVAFPLATDGEHVDMLLFVFAIEAPKPAPRA